MTQIGVGHLAACSLTKNSFLKMRTRRDPPTATTTLTVRSKEKRPLCRFLVRHCRGGELAMTNPPLSKDTTGGMNDTPAHTDICIHLVYNSFVQLAWSYSNLQRF